MATGRQPHDAKERMMATKNSRGMLMLAVVAAVSLNTAAMAQQVSRRSRDSKVTEQRDTTRSGVPGKVKVLRPAPNTNELPKRTDKEKEFAAAAALMAPYKQWMIGANATGFVYPNLSSGPASKKYNLKGIVPHSARRVVLFSIFRRRVQGRMLL